MNKLYKTLLENGDLFELFPNFSGEWEKDKKAFIREQKEIESIIENKDIDFEEDFD